MRPYRLPHAVVVLALVAVAGCSSDPEPDGTGQSPAPAQTEDHDESAGDLHRGVPLGEHQYDVYVPVAAVDDNTIPVVIALHGRPGSSVESQAHLQPLADDEQFLIAYPRFGGSRWQTDVDSPDVDDIRQLINELVDDWDADPARVYVTGMSAGGDMAIAIGLQLPDLVAAIAPVVPPADPAVAELLERFAPRVPLVAFVGADDTRFADRSLHLLDEWQIQAGCGEENRTDDGTVVTSTWTCADESALGVHLVQGQGHVWFGTPDARESLWASEAMWEFFTTLP